LIQSMLSGHAGSLTTVHASTPRDSAMRLETLCLMSDIQLPVHVARAQVASALQLIVQLSRFADGSRRVVLISEALGLDAENRYQFQDLYRFRSEGRDDEGRIVGQLEPTGKRPSFAAEPFSLGLADRVQLTGHLFSQGDDPSKTRAESPEA
jgi:pilus assembly protein CpaF